MRAISCEKIVAEVSMPRQHGQNGRKNHSARCIGHTRLALQLHGN
jgi:hypothetical protein